ncbi:prolactin-3D4-like [Cricetulus griseus]|uniref:Prolactin-3D4-like n=1 Tax=Cricetulus griseus TaxID=10029 RepID=A0A9J7FTE9_CRIGR|nr:prolactin-3D4-like [Cricetulus griseus]XP_027265049.1 prolactin-3D4-like [Cricetulus griseus]
MKLAFTLPRSAGMYMLLLVSTLLLWEHVASKPSGLVSIEALYNRVVEHSHTSYVLAADIYREFDLNFFKRSWFTDRTLSLCHTASIYTPETRQEVHDTKTEDLLKAIVNITHSWEEPLKHLLSAVPTLPGASDNMLKSANAVKEKNHILLEGIEAILNKTQVEVEDDTYPDWSGLSDLQSSDEETRLFEFFNLCRCLRRDTHKVDTFLKVLRCRVVYNNECMYYQ